MTAPDDDLNKTPSELIAEMQQLIRGSPGNPAFNTITAMSALRKFACVLVVLSRDAAKQTKRVVGLTRMLLWLTIVLLAVAAIQTALMFVEHRSATYPITAQPSGRYYFVVRDDGFFRDDTLTGKGIMVGLSQGQAKTVNVPFDQ